MTNLKARTDNYDTKFISRSTHAFNELINMLNFETKKGKKRISLVNYKNIDKCYNDNYRHLSQNQKKVIDKMHMEINRRFGRVQHRDGSYVEHDKNIK